MDKDVYFAFISAPVSILIFGIGVTMFLGIIFEAADKLYDGMTTFNKWRKKRAQTREVK